MLTEGNTPAAQDSSKYHIKAIDSLRGLAAVSVFFFHMWSFNLPEDQMFRPWFFLLAGHEAVVFFFVLSGFILTLSYERGKLTYPQYFIRRIFRIYPAYYLSMLIGVGMFILINPQPLTIYTPWFNTQFSTIELTWKTFYDTLFLVTNTVSHINGAVWSLVYEVIISTLLLPLFWKLKTKKGFLLLGLAYVTFFVARQIFHPRGIIVDRTIYFSVFFYMGYLVFHFRDNLAFLGKPIFLPVYMFCYASLYFTFGNEIFDKATIRDFLSGFGSVGFLCFALHNKSVRTILQIKVISFYGKISYSFYLFHICVMYSIVYIFHTVLPLYVMIALIFTITTVLSTLIYFTVEKPFIGFGKKITAKLGREN